MEELIKSFGLDGRLLIMQIINFSILLFLLWRFLYKPIFAIIDKRQKTIEEGVRNADEAKKKLADSDEEASEILASARKDGDGIISQAKNTAEDKKSEILAEAQDRADKVATDAERQASELKKTALQESKEEIARTAILAAEKVLRKELK